MTKNKFLVSEPKNYAINYEINSWMQVTRKAEPEKALREWQELLLLLKRAGGELHFIEQPLGVPDLVFTANAGLVFGKDVVISTFRFQERQAEVPFFKEWFSQNGYNLYFLPPGVTFEGEGDALFWGEKLVIATGLRTDIESHERVGELFQKEVTSLQLIDPRFYHLDTCFCPLNSESAYFYPQAFDPKSIKILEKLGELIPILENEAINFACNAVPIGSQVIIPARCPKTISLLIARGFTVYDVILDEFLKAGGAAKCLVLRI
jgi:N-dimethylarginine dimethylaminohydrolase